jgi:FkbM family methyltransferase
MSWMFHARRFVGRFLGDAASSLISKPKRELALAAMASLFRLDLLEVAHRKLGVRRFFDETMSSQVDLVAPVLSRHLARDGRPPVIIDVGAHRGDFAVAMKERYPDSKVIAFEPNSNTFRLLTETITRMDLDIRAIERGVGRESSSVEIFDYSSDQSSEHCSIYRGVFETLHQTSEICSSIVEITTLDNYCRQHGIARVDFLKIDVEGGELSVLEGAKTLIAEGGLPIIQFEFNEMNVVSRVFLLNFYSVLPEYSFFRLAVDRLIPLGDYSSTNEIFQYQNLLAVAPTVSVDEEAVDSGNAD